MSVSWDRWHDFPGVTPSGENPDPGDRVEIEYQSRHGSVVQDSPENSPQLGTFTWPDLKRPKELQIGYDLKRWRHLDREQAIRWQSFRDQMERRPKS
jgi:hypothetical protein